MNGIGYLGLALSALAAEAGPPLVNEIRIVGLERTADDVVRQELLVAAGAPLDPQALLESVQRLKNLLIFSRVEPRTLERPDGSVDLELSVEERWTLIPIARFGGGGGASYFIVGAYDVNSFGRYLEIGAQYENLVGAHSGVVWLRKPRLFGLPYKLGADVWRVSRPRLLYDEGGVLEGGFTLSRLKINAFAEHEAARWLFLGAGAEVDLDSFGQRGLPPAARDLNQRSGNALIPERSRAVLLRTWARLGRIDHDVYLVRGLSVFSTWEQAARLLGSELSFYRATTEIVAAWRPAGTHNVAVRLQLGASNAPAWQHAFYIGGLDAVRGFHDGELRGRHYWLANLEYRLSSYTSDWLVVQHNFFVDAGGVPGRPMAASVGPGLRLLSPRVYRLTLRLDYAYTLHPRGRHGVSFGVQQLF